MGAAGIDVQNAEAEGQVELLSRELDYLKPGGFDQDAMVELLRTKSQPDLRSKTGLTRLWANMAWALQDFPGAYDFPEYESRLNDVLPLHELPLYEMATICTCDLTMFSASLIVDWAPSLRGLGRHRARESILSAAFATHRRVERAPAKA
jgi:hypothetical protein